MVSATDIAIYALAFSVFTTGVSASYFLGKQNREISELRDDVAELKSGNNNRDYRADVQRQLDLGSQRTTSLERIVFGRNTWTRRDKE